MLHFEVHDEKTGERVHLGKIGEFIERVTNDIARHPIMINSTARLSKELQFAFDREIQRRRDNY